MTAGDHQSPTSITDSPWFWILMFSLAALAALAAMSPKYQRRQDIIETKFHARERTFGREAKDASSQPPEHTRETPAWQQAVPLLPIAIPLLTLATISAIALVRTHRLRNP